MHRAEPRAKALDVLQRRIPAGDARYKNVAAVTQSGASLRGAAPGLSASGVAKARSEIFGRIKPRQLLELLGDGAAAVAEEAEEEGGAPRFAAAADAGAPRFVTVDAGAVGASSSPTSPARRGGGGGAPEVLILDARGAEHAELFAAVRVLGAQHAPAKAYTTQDRLPAAVHAARRAAPQPLVVVYDEGGLGAHDAVAVAEKLVAVGRFDAAMVLDGGLRAAALDAPRLLEGSQAAAYVAGCLEEAGLTPRGRHRAPPRAPQDAASPTGSSASAAGGSGADSVRSGRGGGSVSGSVRSTGTFGASKRW